MANIHWAMFSIIIFIITYPFPTTGFTVWTNSVLLHTYMFSKGHTFLLLANSPHDIYSIPSVLGNDSCIPDEESEGFSSQ